MDLDCEVLEDVNTNVVLSKNKESNNILFMCINKKL